MRWILGALLSMLVACAVGSCRNKRQAPFTPPTPPKPTVILPPNDIPTNTDERIRWLVRELAAVRAEKAEEHRAALARITDAQVRWATWGAGVAALLATLWTVAAFIWHLPKRWGAIGLIVSGALLVGARAWDRLAGVSDVLALIVLGGGALTAIVVLVAHHHRERLPRWLSRILF